MLLARIHSRANGIYLTFGAAQAIEQYASLGAPFSRRTNPADRMPNACHKIAFN